MSPAPKGSVPGCLSLLRRHDREFLCVTLASVLEVHLLLERTDDLARIVATDTGIKIPQDAPPHLSEEFFPSKNTEAVEGTDGRLAYLSSGTRSTDTTPRLRHRASRAKERLLR